MFYLSQVAKKERYPEIVSNVIYFLVLVLLFPFFFFKLFALSDSSNWIEPTFHKPSKNSDKNKK